MRLGLPATRACDSGWGNGWPVWAGKSPTVKTPRGPTMSHRGQPLWNPCAAPLGSGRVDTPSPSSRKRLTAIASGSSNKGWPPPNSNKKWPPHISDGEGILFLFDPVLSAAQRHACLSMQVQRSGHRGPPPRHPVGGPLRTVSLGWLSSGGSGRECLRERASVLSIPPRGVKLSPGLPHDLDKQVRLDKHVRKWAWSIA